MTQTTLKRLEISSIFKHWEEDKFKQGCIPDTGSIDTWDVKLCADDQQSIIEAVCEELGIDYNPENVLINSCDEIGRVDIQVLETDNGTEATASELKAWKAGKLRLWHCTYTVNVEEVERKPFNLS